MKRKRIKTFYADFLTELKVTNPSKWYSMAKKIGAVDEMNSGEVIVDELEGLSNLEGAERIAQHFSSVSNEYPPIDLAQLPAYLPATKPEQVDELSVYKKINGLKNTKSTMNIDLPNKLRKEFSVELTPPLTDIINSSLSQFIYPKIWKHEWITPAPKVTCPKLIKDLRKISSTSDFSKVFESFLRDWILEDICKNIDPGQFGSLKGTGTEHMLVFLVDRILKLLETVDSAVVVAALVDWSAAFDRQDPTIGIQRFIQMGVRPSLVPILVSYLSDRKMTVKFNGEVSNEYALIGGGPQGTLLGGLEYLVQSNENAECVEPEDRYKFVDDLSVLEIISVAGLLQQYNYLEHVPSDVGTDQLFLPSTEYKTQQNLNSISQWTDVSKMKLNTDKSNYMMFTRTDYDFATRLTVNGVKLDQLPEAKVLGVWLTEDLTWSKNTKEICKNAYSRISMITKLKYVGVSIEDLLDIYVLFIRSLLEYCCVLWHSNLTNENQNDLERVQRTCLKIILGDMYVSYAAALEMTNLKTLGARREDRCADFAKKCLKNPRLSHYFPTNPTRSPKVRKTEKFVVNFAKTKTYRMSSVPYLQRKLNLLYQQKKI